MNRRPSPPRQQTTARDGHYRKRDPATWTPLRLEVGGEPVTEQPPRWFMVDVAAVKSTAPARDGKGQLRPARPRPRQRRERASRRTRASGSSSDGSDLPPEPRRRPRPTGRSKLAKEERRNARRFIAELLRGVPDHLGVGVCGSGGWNDLRVFSDPAEIVSRAVKLDRQRLDAYLTPGLFEIGDARRTIETCRGLVGVWLEIDIKGRPQREGKVKREGAVSWRDAVRLACAIVTPTYVVRTGGGLHAWYLFEKPWIFESDEDREQAAQLVKAWFRAHRDLADFPIDPAHDLTRLLRLPATHNYKAEPRRAVFVRRVAGGGPYAREELASLVSPYSEAHDGHAPVSIDGYLDVPDDRLAELKAVPDVARVGNSTFDSPSERDFVLALEAMCQGATDPEAAALIRYVRGDEKGNREDYLARTVTKGRARFVNSSGSSDRFPVLGAAALHGVAGKFVRLIEPHTEAHTAAILVQFLALAGNVFGRQVGFEVEGDRHHGNMFVALVGESSKGRKGTALGQVKRPFELAATDWLAGCLRSGLSTGEGLIFHVRDPQPGKDDKSGDPGVADKRLVAVEPEFAGVLRRMGRENNSLGVVLRQAWDGNNLATLTKREPQRATDPHVSVIVHVTRADLDRYLTDIDLRNGFGNRFLWVLVRRSKLLPHGGDAASVDLTPLADKLAAAIQFANERGPLMLPLDSAAKRLWEGVYPALSDGPANKFGAATSRAEAQVRRLAVLYAVLDQSEVVGLVHLQAALAVWRYCEDSARVIFDGGRPHGLARRVLAHLEQGGDWPLTRLHKAFSNNLNADELRDALHELESQGLAEQVPGKSPKGRDVTCWRARTTNQTNSTNAGQASEDTA